MFPTRGASHLDDALRETLAHAARAPFYKKLWGEKARSVMSRAELARLPLLDKLTAAEHQEALRVPGIRATHDFAEAGVVSSATTRTGRPLRILRSVDEAVPAANEADITPHRTLVIFSPRHGVRSADGPGRIGLPATLHPNTVDVALDLLGGREPRIRFLVAPLSTLKWMTVAMEKRGVDLGSFGIGAIGTTGYPLTDHARRWLGRAWSAQLFDNYSLSEIPGYAGECESCEYQHWHGPPVIAELVDPLTGRVIDGKEGELVLTTLVPAVLRMPLIRYRTGDYVERGPACRSRSGIRFLGRVGHSLFARRDGRSRPVVLSRDLLELGESAVDVAMHPHPAETLGRVPPSDLGVPKILVDTSARRIRAELRYAPERYPEAAAYQKRRAETRGARNRAARTREPRSHEVGPEAVADFNLDHASSTWQR
ncbi:MAG: hypothetical protein HY791_20160 [Deltaproteobacteria bacterium]|nr:hypothetical protein [Deltaproteobacteria bacterium]